MTPLARAQIMHELEEYFATSEADHGLKSNFGDMTEKMANLKFATEFDDDSMINLLDRTRHNRRIRSRLTKLCTQDLVVLAHYFCDPRAQGLSGKLELYLTYHDPVLSRRAQDFKASGHLIGLIQLAKQLKQKPEDLLEQALTAYLDIRRDQ